MKRTYWLLALCALLALASRHEATPPIVADKYGVPYQPLGPSGISAADAKRIIELLESIDSKLSAPAEVKQGPDVLAVAKLRCAACHTPEKSKTKGGDFILFTNDAAQGLKPLSDREKGRVKEAVLSGTMPPAKKLSPAEQAAFKW